MRRALLRLALIWAALLLLLALTIAATFLPAEPARSLASYGIAALKGGLILWFFVELRGGSGLLRAAAVAGFAWLVLLMSMVSIDDLTRG